MTTPHNQNNTNTYKTKAFEIKAHQFVNPYAFNCFLQENNLQKNVKTVGEITMDTVMGQPDGNHQVQILSKQGWVNLNLNDFVIIEPDGSGIYPCAPQIFGEKYELVN